MLRTIRDRKSQAGFTLVELMVVVAIIGILLVIGVPQYAKFQAKARQTEIKNQLGAVYTSETSFAAENQSFTACLEQIGFNRDGAKQYYWVGFDTPGAASIAQCSPAPGGTRSCLEYQWTNVAGVWGAPNNIPVVCADGNNNTFFQATVSDGAPIIRSNIPAAVITGANGGVAGTFRIGGAGRINRGATSGNPVGIDQWNIDQAKNLVNVQSGL